MQQSITNVTVIGSGTMGNGICHVFAQSGFTVSMMDIKQDALDKAIATISKNMDRQVAKGSLTEDDKTQALARISRLLLDEQFKAKLEKASSPEEVYQLVSSKESE